MLNKLIRLTAPVINIPFHTIVQRERLMSDRHREQTNSFWDKTNLLRNIKNCTNLADWTAWSEAGGRTVRHGGTAGHTQTRTCHLQSRSTETPAALPPDPPGTGSWGTLASSERSRRKGLVPSKWAALAGVPSIACSGTRPVEEIEWLVLEYS